MSQTDDASIATSASLLGRLKNLDDQASWQRFFDTYWRLIHGVALKAGLTEAEAQDVVQETVISVARHLPGFRYDPKVCSFKSWMLRLTRWRIIDQLRKRLPSDQRIDISSDDDSTATAALDQLTGGKAPELEAAWNEEWEKAVLAAAIERVKQSVSPDQFQMFDLYVLRQMPVTEVARLLGTNVPRVYLTKHRLSKLLRSTVAELEGTEFGL
ncbi:MAG: sigma-70 family RNA polymerase sigma factor [Verrucomicrobia bacterium]|nr:sigma-70 family RNA polymerase sigma factor [Verrucomicrobiota bacterium]